MGKFSLKLGALAIEGESRAGDQTWFRVHPPGIAFDAGRGALPLAGAPCLFLSHGHLDHALGVPFVLSQRAMHASGETRVYCPAPSAEDLERLVRAASRLEGTGYRGSVEPLVPGQRVEVGRRLAVEAFATDHLGPSLGYHLVETRRRLSPAYRGRSAAEIVAARAAGEEVETEHEVVRLTYCGDTGPGVFDAEPRLFTSEVLLIECTFLGPESRDRGLRYRHLHVEDFRQRASRFRNQAIVLHHLSRRFRLRELRAAVDLELAGLSDRIHVWGLAD